MNPHLLQNLAYTRLTGFTSITGLVSCPWVVAVNAAVPANSFQELLALAKQKPGTLSYASFGNGSSAHIAFDYLKKITGTDFLHVPYKGAAPGITDLLSGRISMMVVTPLLVEGHARAGKLRLPPATTAQRIPQLPDLPGVGGSPRPGSRTRLRSSRHRLLRRESHLVAHINA